MKVIALFIALSSALTSATELRHMIRGTVEEKSTAGLLSCEFAAGTLFGAVKQCGGQKGANIASNCHQPFMDACEKSSSVVEEVLSRGAQALFDDPIGFIGDLLKDFENSACQEALHE